MVIFMAAASSLRVYVDRPSVWLLALAIGLYTAGNLMMVRVMRESGLAVAMSLSAVLQLVLINLIDDFWRTPVDHAGRRHHARDRCRDHDRLASGEARMNKKSFIWDRLVPVGSILLVILIAWYFAAYSMNAPFQRDFDRRAGETRTATEFLMKTMSQPKPTMPAPHQVASNLWKNTLTVKPWSKRSLVYHSWITLSATLLGFAMGTALGVVIAIGIVHIPALDRSFLPWIIASQTIPILAIAPMIIVLLSAIGVTGLLPKALISTYLSFFPVAVGMVKGLRSPDVLHLDLMRTYSATKLQMLWKLRIPASVPFFFTSMKVAIAASLIGAIVGELPTGAVAGIGSKLLAGSYYSQTVDIFAALIAGSIVAILLVSLVDIVGRFVNGRMGARNP